MRIKWKNICCWMVATFLLMTYVFILYRGIRPNVCLEYQMYYVDGTLVDWPGYGGLKYELGTEQFFGINYSPHVIRGIGWGNREAEACWTVGNQAKLYFDLSDELLNGEFSNYIVRFDIVQSLADAKVQVAGIDVGTIEKGETLFTGVIPKGAINDGILELEILIENPICPSDISDSDDKRQLGVMLKSIVITKADYHIGEILNFGFDDGNSAISKGEGWSHIEKEGCWTIGEKAVLYFDMSKELVEYGTYNLNLEFISYLADLIEVNINDFNVGKIDKENKVCSLDVPVEVLKDGFLKVEFLIKNPVRPCDVTDSTDSRRLGIMLKNIYISMECNER